MYEHNPWLTYGEPLHRLREFGIPIKEIDLLDEAALSLDQIRLFCSLLLVCEDRNFFSQYLALIGIVFECHFREEDRMITRTLGWADGLSSKRLRWKSRSFLLSGILLRNVHILG